MAGELDLDALAALEKAATPGPWEFYDRCGKGPEATDSHIGYEVEGPPQPMRGQFERGADAVFVAAARNALPRLLALARAGERLAALWRKHGWSLDAEAQDWLCPECCAVEPDHTATCPLAAALADWRAAREGR